MKRITIDSVVKNSELIPMSDKDIIDGLNGDCVIIENSTIPTTYSSLDQIFSKSNNCVVFWQDPSDEIGHWSCFKNVGDKVLYFDSYGQLPEEVCENLHIVDNLTPLLQQHDVVYNRYRYQSNFKDINTCGKHVMIFLKMGLNLEEYYYFMSSSKNNPDYIVSMMSFLL